MGKISKKAEDIVNLKLHKLKVLSKDKFLERCVRQYGNKYTYNNTDYIGMYIPISVTCVEHGDFMVIPRNFLRGTECQLCKNKFNSSIFDKTTLFIVKSKAIHGDKYSYTKSIYTGYNKKLTITCNLHGDFEQSPSGHLTNKSGCPICGKNNRLLKKLPYEGVRSLKNSWIKLCDKVAFLYIIYCTNCKETFIKVGISKYNDLKKRYTCKKSIPYTIKTLGIYEDTPENIWAIEKSILKNYKEYKYIPAHSFHGNGECLSIEVLKPLNDYINALYK